jgi:5-methylcytosine-specific restriction enzyme subunit McrC
VPWAVAAEDAANANHLPDMRTDITLRAQGRHIVIEAKCTAHTHQSSYGTTKLRSDHLYQLLAYLTNLRARGIDPVGLLLYAQAGHDMRYDYELQGIPVRVRSLDLEQPWRTVRSDLLALIGELDQNGHSSPWYAASLPAAT